jgi:hypothetical protein
LRVEAEVVSAFSCRFPPALDSILASQVALRDDYVPPEVEERIPPAPLLWHPAGFHHASQAHYQISTYDLRHWTKKTPTIADFAALTTARKINVSAGQFKPYYLPLRCQVPAGILVWWCVGDPQEIAALLGGVTNIGAKAGHGYGRVAHWRIVPVGPEEEWSLLRPDDHTGRMIPTRNLPPELAPEDWPYLRMAPRTYPYWRQDRCELLAVPEPPREVER